MFRALALNSAVNAAAFFASGLIALLLVPVLVGQYGIEDYGLIVLARLFLPIAFLAVLDFGFSELATQGVARQRVSGDWGLAGRQLTTLLLVALVTGAFAGTTMAVFADSIAAFLKVNDSRHASFVLVLYATAAALPLLFAGLVGEGVLRGFEAYRRLRVLEILVNLAFAMFALIFIQLGLTVFWVALLFVGTQCVKAIAIGSIAIHTLKRHGGIGLGAGSLRLGHTFQHVIGQMWANKLLGVLHTQAPPLVVSAVLGPAAAGVFDVIVRLPRFVKSVLGLLNSSVLPVAARLHESGDTVAMSRLGRVGVRILAYLVLPPMFSLALVSDRILGLWLGDDYAHLGWSTAAMFVSTGLGVIVNFGGSALMVDRHGFQRWTILSATQMLLQYLIAWYAFKTFGAAGLVIGIVVAGLMVFPFQARLIADHYGVDFQAWLRVAGLTTMGLLLLAIRLVPNDPIGLSGVFETITVFIVTVLIQWGIGLQLVFDSTERVSFKRALRDLFGKRVSK